MPLQKSLNVFLKNKIFRRKPANAVITAVWISPYAFALRRQIAGTCQACREVWCTLVLQSSVLWSLYRRRWKSSFFSAVKNWTHRNDDAVFLRSIHWWQNQIWQRPFVRLLHPEGHRGCCCCCSCCSTHAIRELAIDFGLGILQNTLDCSRCAVINPLAYLLSLPVTWTLLAAFTWRCRFVRRIHHPVGLLDSRTEINLLLQFFSIFRKSSREFI